MPAPPQWLVVLGGITLLVLVGLQILIGMRKVRFRGPLHMKVHKGVAWGILALGAVHGVAALVFLGIIG